MVRSLMQRAAGRLTLAQFVMVVGVEIALPYPSRSLVS